MGTYTPFTIASAAEVGLFGQAFLDGIGVRDDVDWLIIALVAGRLMAILAFGDIRVATRSLLGMEGISVTLILILMVVIFVKLIGGSAPSDQGFTADVFKLPPAASRCRHGRGRRGVRLPVVRRLRGRRVAGRGDRQPGAQHPARDLHRGRSWPARFYIVCMVAQSLGFGTDAAGIKRFSESSAPLGDLGKDYVGSGFADVINFGATISAFAGRAGRRDRGLADPVRDRARRVRRQTRLGRASTRSGAPAGALAVVLGGRARSR